MLLLDRSPVLLPLRRHGSGQPRPRPGGGGGGGARPDRGPLHQPHQGHGEVDSTVQHSTVQYNTVQVIGQINAILGITTTTPPCTGLVGGGLLCPPALPIPGK